MKVQDKYSPTNLNEVIYPNAATAMRIQALGNGQLEGHVLLWGPNGTAKTSIAHLLIQAIGGADATVDDVDYSELLSKPDLKQHIKNSCSISSLYGQGKFFILLNEFDTAKVNPHTLWTTMDQCGNDLMIIFTTNEPLKVHRSVRSRCIEIEMPALTAQQVLDRAQQILCAEGLVLPDAQVLHYLKTKQYSGDLRKYFSALDELLLLNAMASPCPHGKQSNHK